jgi:hypothetical protein
MTIAAQLNTVMRNGEPGVIEGGPQPRRRRVTRLAGRGESCGHMIRIGGSVVIRLVTRIAVRGGSGELTIDMAARARNGDVRARQGKAGGAVIEGGGRPGRGVVANLALMRESRRLVIRIVRLVVIPEMAGDAGCVSNLEIAAHVATGAGKLHVRTGQRKSRLVVVEAGRRPGRRAVADRAILRKTCRDVIRIGSFLIVGEVARRAVTRRARELPVHVALHAGNVHMRPVNGKVVKVLWLKAAAAQLTVLWHMLQFCGKPAWAWFGLAVF